MALQLSRAPSPEQAVSCTSRANMTNHPKQIYPDMYYALYKIQGYDIMYEMAAASSVHRQRAPRSELWSLLLCVSISVAAGGWTPSPTFDGKK